MVSAITLEGVQLVLSGQFDGVDTEDARWGLISRGARVMTSVNKSTGALLAGSGAKPDLLAKARTLGTPILGAAELRALLDGSPLPVVIAASKGAAPSPAPSDDLRGLHLVFCGKPRGAGQSAWKAELEKRGARVARSISNRTDVLLLGDKPGPDAVEAMDEGVPFLKADAIDKLLAGAPLDRFVGAPMESGVENTAEHIRGVVEAKRAELTAVGDMAGEVWEETMTLTLRPNGRVKVQLVHLGGTPIHDHVREVLQRERWPRVHAPCEVVVPIVFR